jgi:alpha-beta hydrolase superfamily lysophospholipase
MAAFHAYRFTHFYDDASLGKIKPENLSYLEKAQLAFFGARFPKSRLKSLPDLPYEKVLLNTQEGLSLEGWYVKAQPARGTVILYHGHGSSKSGILAEAEYFHELGYHTLAVDFRAHGGSDGKVCTIGYKETEDARLAYEYIVAKGEKNIILWGVSMGAATILKAVPQYGLKPAAIILECPFGTMLDAVKSRVRIMHLPPTPIAEMLTFWGGVEQQYWAFGYQPIEDARQIACPVLLNWGAQDARVTREETDQIYANLPADRKQLVVYAQSGHQSFCRNEEVKWKKAVKNFLTEQSKRGV